MTPMLSPSMTSRWSRPSLSRIHIMHFWKYMQIDSESNNCNWVVDKHTKEYWYRKNNISIQSSSSTPTFYRIYTFIMDSALNVYIVKYARISATCKLWSSSDEKIEEEDDDWINLLFFLYLYSMRPILNKEHFLKLPSYWERLRESITYA